MMCEDGGYFLWVAGLDWGWEEKGLHIFTALARMRPELQFVAYGVAYRRPDLEDRLRILAMELPNFDFRGQLKRGAVHRKVFCEATAFFMPTQPSIGAAPLAPAAAAAAPPSVSPPPSPYPLHF